MNDESRTEETQREPRCDHICLLVDGHQTEHFHGYELPSPRRLSVPRGFTRCDECEGFGFRRCGECENDRDGMEDFQCHDPYRCPSCSGSGLVPTEKLREEARDAVRDVRESMVPGATHVIGPAPEADAVLRKVAEHIGEER